MANNEQQYDLAGEVIGLAMKIHRKLGAGFLESVYQNALVHELGKAGFKTSVEKTIDVYYDDVIVGKFVADIVVNDTLIVETKAISALAKAHEIQTVNYLTATGIETGLLLNFGGRSLEFKKKFKNQKEPEPVALH